MTSPLRQPMQAAPSAQQALPQPQMPPELQRIQIMGLSLQSKLQNDSFLQGIRQQQEKLGATVQQRQRDYLGSIQQFFNNAPPELKRFLSSPRVMQNISMAYADSQQLQPEFAQMRDLSQQYNQYVQTNYGEEQRRLQELQQQAAPQIQQYQNQMQLFNQQQSTALANAQQQIRELRGQTPTIVRNDYDYLPEGLTQEEFMKQARVNMTQQYRTPEQMREYFKPLYDSYLQEKATTKQAQPIQAQPLNPAQQQKQLFDNAQAAAIKKANEKFKERISRPNRPFQQDPIVDPKRPTTTGPRKLTPIKLERSPIQPIVDPKREPFKPPKAITPIIPKPKGPIVDPKREPFKPPKAIKPKGLGNKPKNPNVPSAYQGINTNINRQRQDMR